ncbi:hypothetical protein [Klebsiella phage 05F01]|nr:hypothetical protein [Klebsiella phage 05F01]
MEELQNPAFESWFDDLVTEAKSKSLDIDTSYKGDWIDLFSTGCSISQAIDFKLKEKD